MLFSIGLTAAFQASKLYFLFINLNQYDLTQTNSGRFKHRLKNKRA